jgi:hypothetical protein
MTIKSVKDKFEVGDLIGFLADEEDNHIEDVGIIKPSDASGRYLIHIEWESDGAVTTTFLPDEKNTAWVNFGPKTDELRLFIELKYLQRTGIQWMNYGTE